MPAGCWRLVAGAPRPFSKCGRQHDCKRLVNIHHWALGRVTGGTACCGQAAGPFVAKLSCMETFARVCDALPSRGCATRYNRSTHTHNCEVKDLAPASKHLALASNHLAFASRLDAFLRTQEAPTSKSTILCLLPNILRLLPLSLLQRERSTLELTSRPHDVSTERIRNF